MARFNVKPSHQPTGSPNSILEAKVYHLFSMNTHARVRVWVFSYSEKEREGFHKRAKLFLHEWSHWPFLFSLAWTMRFSSLCSWIDKTHLYFKACRNLFNSLSWVYSRFDEHKLTGEPGLEIRTKLSISRTVKVTRKATMIRLLDISIPYKTGKRFTL